MKAQIVRPLLLLLTLLLFVEVIAISTNILGYCLDSMLMDTRIGLRCSVIAFCYIYVLIQPSMILAFVPVLIDGLIDKWSQGDVNKKHRLQWSFKPLTGCDTCLAGQLAFWTYPFLCYNYSVFYHFYTICIAILFVVYVNSSNGTRTV